MESPARQIPTPEAFLTEFFKEMLNTPDPTNRPALIKGWARLMELREEAIRQDARAEMAQKVLP